MSVAPKQAPPEAASPAADLTGRRQMVGNVLVSWLVQAIMIVAGFVMPRLIDRHIGQELLGVWDFSWSVVGYFALAQFGILGSINRYVGRHQASGDFDGINRAVSSVLCILLGMGFLIIATAALVCFWVLPALDVTKLGSHLLDAQWVVMALGLEVAIETIFSAYGGVLTGCHQWKSYYGIQTATNICTVVAMALGLIYGGSLRLLAATHLAGTIVCWLLIYWMAYRRMPTLQVRFRFASRSLAMDMFSFGTKSFLPQIGELFLNQTVNVLILVYLGPAALALYSRPRSLVQQSRTLVARMSAILIPSVSSIEAMGRIEEIRELILKSTRYAAFLTLPVAAMLSIMGGVILQLWMGPHYKSDIVPLTLSLGSAAMIVLTPALCVLMGMGLHGSPGRIHFIACSFTAAFVWIALGWFKLGIVGAAISASLPLAWTYAIYMPWYLARNLQLPVTTLLKDGLGLPALAVLPMLGCLLIARLFFAEQHPLAALITGCGIGGLFLVPVYWKYALPESLKRRLALFLSSPFVRRLCLNS